MPVCSNCFNPIDSKTKFCPYCDAAVEETLPESTGGTTVATVSKQLTALTKRYRDAYLVSTVTDGFGKLIKAIGILVAGVLVLVGILLVAQGRAGDANFALGIVTTTLGVISGLWFYMVGVLVSANAQVLKASLDGAVNTSPFLTNDDRAKIMSLPQS